MNAETIKALADCDKIVHEIKLLRAQNKRMENILKDGAFQFARLTGQNLEIFSRTYAALAAHELNNRPTSG